MLSPGFGPSTERYFSKRFGRNVDNSRKNARRNKTT